MKSLVSAFLMLVIFSCKDTHKVNYIYENQASGQAGMGGEVKFAPDKVVSLDVEKADQFADQFYAELKELKTFDEEVKEDKLSNVAIFRKFLNQFNCSQKNNIEVLLKLKSIFEDKIIRLEAIIAKSLPRDDYFMFKYEKLKLALALINEKLEGCKNAGEAEKKELKDCEDLIKNKDLIEEEYQRQLSELQEELHSQDLVDDEKEIQKKIFELKLKHQLYEKRLLKCIGKK